MTSGPPLRIPRVFIDTSAYFALAVPQEVNHATATTIVQRLEEQRSHLFTTNFIIAETHALLLARRGRTIAARALAEIDRSRTTVIRVSVRDEQRARRIIYQYDDQDFSLTDATSFAIMERLRIAHAFTFDRHFQHYGFNVLTAEAG